MSKTIDQKVVEMRFDNAQFEQGVSQSIQSVDNLKKSLDFGSLATSLNSGVSSISRSVESIADRFTTFGIIATTTLINIANQAVNTGIALVKSLSIDQIANGFAKYSQMAVSTQTIMSATRNEWASETDQMEYVSKQLGRLLWFTDETSYSFVDMVDSIGKFTSAGVELDTAITNIMGIATWAGLSGQNAMTASRAMYQLAQALGKGYVAAQDWSSIETANMSTAEFNQMVIDSAVELGKLTRVFYEDGDSAVYYTGKLKETQDAEEGMLVTAANLRTTLSEKWFTTDVLTKTLDKFGKFPDAVEKALERINETSLDTLYTTEFLAYIKQYKADIAKLTATTEKFGMTESALRGYISDFNKGTLDIEAVASKYEISVEDLTKELNNYKDGLLDLNEISEEYGADVGILYGEMQKLSDAEYDVGLAAMLASQESRTLEDSINYVKDAVSSGWMTTFNIIIGELLDAKKVFATVSNELYEIFVEDGEKRNEVLKEWAKSGGRSDLLEATLNIWYNIKDVIFAVKDGFHDIFPPATAEQLVKLTEKLKDFTIKFRLSEEQTEKIRNSIANFTKVLDVAWSNIKLISGAITSAWNKIFPQATLGKGVETFEKISEKFGEFVEQFRLGGSQFARLERTLQGVFAAFDIGLQLISALLKPLTGVDISFGGIGDTILETTAKIGDWLVKLDQTIKEEDTFNKAIQKVQDFFAAVSKGIDDVAYSITGKHLDQIWLDIKTFASDAAKSVSDFFSGANSEDAEGTEKKGLDIAKVFETICGWIEELKKEWEKVEPYFSKLGEQILGALDVDNPGDVLKEGGVLAVLFIAAGVLYEIYEFFTWLRDDLIKFIPTIIGQVTLFIDALGEAMWNLNNRIKADVIKTITTAVLELAIACLLLAMVDDDKLARSAVAIGVFLVALYKVFEMATKFSSGVDVGKMFAVSGIIKLFSSALTSIAIAFYIMAHATDDIDLFRQVGEEMAVMMGILAGMLIIFNYVKVDPSTVLSVSTSIRALAVALIAISAAFAITLKFVKNPDDIKQAGLGLGAMLAAIAVFYIAMSKLKINGSQLMKISVAMVLVGAALVLIASSIAIILALGKTKQEMINAAEILAGMMVAIGVFYWAVTKLNIDGKKMITIASSLVIVGIALVLIAAALAIVASCNPDNLSKAMASFIPLLIVIGGGLMAMAKFGSGGDLIKAAAAITVASIGILLLAYALKVLGDSDASVDTAIALGIALLAIVGAGFLAQKVAPGIYALAAACAAVGVAVLLVGLGAKLFVDALANLISQGDELAVMSETFPTFFSNFVEGLAAAGEKISENKETFKTALTSIFEIIIDAIKGVFPNLGELINMGFNLLLSILTAGVPQLVDLIIYITEEVLRGTVAITPMITAAAMALIIDTLQQIADNIFEISYLLTDIALKLTFGLIDAFIDHIPDFIDTGWKFIISLIDGMAEGIENHAEELVEAITHLVEVIIDTACKILGINSPSKEFLEIGKQTIMGMINGFNEKFNEIKNKVTEIVNGIIDKFKEKFEKIKQVGKDLMNGFLEGVNDVAGTIQAGAEFIGDGVVNTFNKVFDINSPSKVMRKIGREVDEGLIVGLNDYSSNIMSTSEDIGNDTIDTLSSVLSDVSDKLQEDVNLDPVIRPVLDLTDVNNGADEINGMLSSDRWIDVAGYSGESVNATVANRDRLFRAFDDLQTTLSNNSNNTSNQTNTFYINGADDPKTTANEISRILQRQVERRNAVWA